MSENIQKIRLIIGEQYEIKRVIKEDEKGGVYLIFHRILQRLDVLKTLFLDVNRGESFKERFKKEMECVFQLNHQGIININDYGCRDKFCYINMEYIEGTTLVDKMKIEGKFKIDDALQIMIDIADALKHAHNNGVIHGNLKPANILLDNNNKAILTDFCTSAMRETSDSSSSHSVDTIPGEFKHQSPEQILSGKFDEKGDLYSLGNIYYELISGKHPLGDIQNTDSVEISQIIKAPENIESICHDIPVQISNIITKLLEKNTENRYDNCHQFLKEMNDFKNSTQEKPNDFDPGLLEETIVFSVSDKNSFDGLSTLIFGEKENHKLTMISEQNTGEEYNLNQPETVIGRSEDCVVKISDIFVSSKHALIRIQGNDRILSDLNSKNGTYVNDSRLDKELLLQNGDEISIGSYRFKYQREG